MKKNVLLTGATGFLGSNIIKILSKENFNIIILKRSFSKTHRIDDIADRIKSYNADQIKLEDIFVENKIDIIVHCATVYGQRDIEPLSLIEANLTLPLQLLELGKKNRVSCFINTDTILDKRVSYYSLSKNQFREWLELYANEMICLNVALEHFYGPYDDNTKFVSYIIDSILNNAEKIDLTAGKQKRDFIYIDDVVSAFIAIIKNMDKFKKGFLRYEIGTGNAVEIQKFVRLVKDIAKNNRTVLNFGAIPYRENETMKSRADITEICKLNWKPEYTLEEGLLRTINIERARIKK
ncbi:MAG: NAD(P)-dependent oxidoreductase [Smithella sp.]